MSGEELSLTMRLIRGYLETIRGEAAEALDKFAQSVAADAKQHAPIRKMYSSKRKSKGTVNTDSTGPDNYWLKAPGFIGPRKGTREPTEDEFRSMSNAAASVGYKLNPKVRIAIRHRNQIGLNARNKAASKWRTLGSVTKHTAKVTGDTYYSFKPRHGVRAKASVTPSLQNKPGVFELPKVGNITVGKGLTRYMSSRQSYAVLHNDKSGAIHVHRTRSGSLKLQFGGTLRDSISANADGLTATISATAPYAKYVEFGTRYMDAQPFLTPAMMHARRRMQRAIKNEIRG